MSLCKNTGHPVALRLLVVSLVLFAIVLAMGPPGLAQTNRGPSTSEPPPSLEERDVEAFMDGYVGHQLEDYGIPGAPFPS